MYYENIICMINLLMHDGQVIFNAAEQDFPVAAYEANLSASNQDNSEIIELYVVKGGDK